MKISSIVTAVCIGFIAVTAEAGQFFRCEGTNIVDRNGDPFIARGLVLSGWLLPEAYGLSIDSVHYRYLDGASGIEDNIVDILNSQSDADAFWAAFRTNWVAEADIAHFSDIGFTAIRVPFNYRLLSPENSPTQYNEAGFEMLDMIIAWCRSNELAVVLDMHACPGGQSHDAYADPEYSYWYWDSQEWTWMERGVQVMWESNASYYAATGRTPEFNQQRTADIWREIADRYKDEEWILGYELANEPYFYESAGVTTNDLRAFFMNVSAAVREVDTNHIVFVEGNIFAEMIDGLLPPWDNNMAVAFHRYWRETGYEDGKVQEYLDARAQHNVPFLMTESGENSNPWIYEIKELMEDNNIGWFYWGFKKADPIATAYPAEITPDYQYVINNWRDNPTVDAVRAKSGLMDLADRVATTNCGFRPGFFAAMLDPLFGVSPQPFTDHNIPGIVQCVDYDVGNQGVAYSDTRYKNEVYQGDAWNEGWIYRNDGVDIVPDNDNDASSIGLHVGYIDDGEWLKYTVNVAEGGYYSFSMRVATPWGGKLQLLNGTNDLTGQVDVINTGGWDTWATQEEATEVYLPTGTNTLQLKIITGGFDIAWMGFSAASNLLGNGALTGSGNEPNSWSQWNDGSHDADSGTRRGSSGNSWVFWWDGGIYQDVANGFSSGDTLSFGGYLYTPSSDALRNGTKYGVIELEFYNNGGTKISMHSASPVINSSSAGDTWIPVSGSATAPSAAATARIVVRCNDAWSGDGRFLVDDVYLR